jgi:alpha-L-fucosidase 2
VRQHVRCAPRFQIDGNFGGTSAVAKMLVQCDDREIRLLPALPSAWPDGSAAGLRLRGGFKMDLSWENSALERVTVRSLLGEPLRLLRGDAVRTLDRASRGAVLMFTNKDLRPSKP